MRSLLVLLPLCLLTTSHVGASAATPVTPEAMPEAVALLDFLQSISGRYTLTGQHNYPATGARNSDFATKYTGKIPAVWTSDFGFAEEGDTDSYLARPIVVAEAIRQHRMGAIVSLCWHAVPPTAEEPVTFRPRIGDDPAKLHSIQGKLTDDQFKDVLTPGTTLHAQWEKQVDAIAVFLKQLQEARVPVLWRPYHEMNGGWFWWGGRHEGKYSTAALYRQIFDRLVHHHHLKNLIWEWSVDRISGKPEREYTEYFPGIDFVDVLCLDVYRKDFDRTYYDKLVALSQGKPLALAEVGNPPPPEILAQQPLWTYYAVWAGMVRNTPKREYATLFADPRVLGLNDSTYADVTASYREACRLAPVSVALAPPDFSGTWILDADASSFGPFGAGFVPSKLVVSQSRDSLSIKSTWIVEYADDKTAEVALPLDGIPVNSAFMDWPRTSTATLSPDKASVLLKHTTEVPFGPPGSKVTTQDTWKLADLGDRLVVHSVTPSMDGSGDIEQTLAYDKR